LEETEVPIVQRTARFVNRHVPIKMGKTELQPKLDRTKKPQPALDKSI
jgi:hypothetical protein